jgi:hypothetical protein
MSTEPINFNKILKDSRETLLNPLAYFQSLSLTGGLTEPLVKAAIYGAVAGLFSLLWSVTGLSAVGAGWLGGAVGIMALIWAIIGAIIGLFIGGAIMLVISAICGGNTDYEANVRVTASLMAIYPVNAALAFFYGINLTLGGIVALAVSCYAIYLLYLATIHALKGKKSNVQIVAIVLLVLALLGFFGGRRVSKSVRNFSDMYEQELVD